MTDGSPNLDGFSDCVESESDDFSITYQALQESVGRTVAIKVFLPDSAQGLSRRWERERAALGRLSAHPNILSVFDSGSLPDGRLYIIMDANAATLSSIIATDGPIPAATAAIWGVKLAGALETAHELGVLHRDLSPINVVVSPFNEPMLTGFGIADVAGISAGRTRTISTSDWYVAPEVLSGSRTTTESDVYSLGSVLYTAIAGRAAHPRKRGRSMVQEIVRIQTEPIVPPENVDVPNQIWEVIAKAMAIQPTDRYRTAAEFGAALQYAGRESGYAMPPLRLQSGDTTEDMGGDLPHGSVRTQMVERKQRKQPETPPSAQDHRRRFSRLTHPAVLAVIGLLAVIGAVTMVIALNGSSDAPPTASTSPNESNNSTDGGASSTALAPPSGQTNSSYEVAEDGTLIVMPQDTGTDVSIELQTRPAAGTVVIRPQERTLRYFADGGFIGTDEFTYSVCGVDACADHTVSVTVRKATGAEMSLVRIVESDRDTTSCRISDAKTFADAPETPTAIAAAVCEIDGADVMIVKWGLDGDSFDGASAFSAPLQRSDGTRVSAPEEWYVDGESQGVVVAVTNPSSGAYVLWDVQGDPDLNRSSVSAFAVLRTPNASGAATGDAIRGWWEKHNSILTDVATIRRDTVGFFSNTTAGWRLFDRDGSETSFTFGDASDLPIVGDWNCDSVDTVGVFRPATATIYLRNTNNEGAADIQFRLGNPGDIPIAGDFDGDGCDTVALYRPSTQTFFIFNSLAQARTAAVAHEFRFGDPGDQPLAGDWDGDGVDTVGLFRAATGSFIWSNERSASVAEGRVEFGDRDGIAVAGAWDGIDHIDTPAVFRSSTSTITFQQSLTVDMPTTELLIGGGETGTPLAGVFE